MDDRYVKVLLVEDDEDDALLVRDWLAESETAQFALEWVNDLPGRAGVPHPWPTRCVPGRLSVGPPQRSGISTHRHSAGLLGADDPPDGSWQPDSRSGSDGCWRSGFSRQSPAQRRPARALDSLCPGAQASRSRAANRPRQFRIARTGTNRGVSRSQRGLTC